MVQVTKQEIMQFEDALRFASRKLERGGAGVDTALLRKAIRAYKNAVPAYVEYLCAIAATQRGNLQLAFVVASAYELEFQDNSLVKRATECARELNATEYLEKVGDVTFDEDDFQNAQAWLKQFLSTAWRDLPSEKFEVDLKAAMTMCGVDPKSARLAMDMVAHSLKDRLGSLSVSEAPAGTPQKQRLMLGAVFISYCVARGFNERTVQTVPLEFGSLLWENPVILECANFVFEQHPGLLLGIIDQREMRPWWVTWRKP